MNAALREGLDRAAQTVARKRASVDRLGRIVEASHFSLAAGFMPDDFGAPIERTSGIRFGRCRLSAATREIWVDSRAVHLEPKAFNLLLYLIAQRDRVVPKDELLEQIWHTVCVSESALAQMIMKVRRGIGDGQTGVHFIRTVQRIGYRFVGAVEIDPGQIGATPLKDFPGFRVDLARSAYHRALRAARLGRADLALLHCLECGSWDPRYLEIGLYPTSGCMSPAAPPELVLRCRDGATTTEVEVRPGTSVPDRPE
jgi:DNA-binding winged helix-turn-helix (wHTH) protein